MSAARFLRGALALATLGALVLPTAAHADDAKLACITQLDRAQSLQSARKLTSARASFLACAIPTCPELVRQDCSKSAVEVEQSLPSLTFSARESGRDLDGVRVMLDGEAVGSALDGHAVVVDPGPHVARFERTGGGVVELRVVAREGEKNRAVSATFASPLATSDKPKEAASHGTTFPTLPVILGGTSLLAIGGGLYLRLDANADANRLHGSCAPACDQSQRDALSDKLVVANVAIGVGVGALALAAATWLAGNRH